MVREFFHASRSLGMDGRLESVEYQSPPPREADRLMPTKWVVLGRPTDQNVLKYPVPRGCHDATLRVMPKRLCEHLNALERPA